MAERRVSRPVAIVLSFFIIAVGLLFFGVAHFMPIMFPEANFGMETIAFWIVGFVFSAIGLVQVIKNIKS